MIKCIKRLRQKSGYQEHNENALYIESTKHFELKEGLKKIERLFFLL
jgi:hypothetical protein